MSAFEIFFAIVFAWTVAYCFYRIIMGIVDGVELNWVSVDTATVKRPLSLNDLVREYDKLQGTPSGHRHAKQAEKLAAMIHANPDLFYAAMLSPDISEESKSDLILWSTDHFGSCALRDNQHWNKRFFPWLWENRDNVGSSVKMRLEWLRLVHGYGEQVET